jgi:hypothetical protein
MPIVPDAGGSTGSLSSWVQPATAERKSKIHENVPIFFML